AMTVNDRIIRTPWLYHKGTLALPSPPRFTLCLSSEVEVANHNETVSDASKSERKWSSKFLHSMSPFVGPVRLPKGWRHPQLGAERNCQSASGRFKISCDYSQRPMIAAAFRVTFS